MAEFEIEAKVTPTLDQRQKRKVQKELGGMSAGAGMGAGGSSKRGLKRMNDSLNDIHGTLEQIRTLLAGGSGIAGALRFPEMIQKPLNAFMGRMRAGVGIKSALKGALSQTDTFGKPLTGGLAQFTDAEHRQLKSLGDLRNDVKTGFLMQVGRLDGIRENTIKAVAGFSMMIDTFVGYGESMVKWLKITAINTGQIGKQILLGLGKALLSFAGSIVTAIGGLGALLKAGLAGLTIGIVGIISQILGAGEVREERRNRIRGAFDTIGESPMESMKTIATESLKTSLDPTGIGEKIGEGFVNYLKRKFPKTSSMIGDEIDIASENFKSNVDRLKDAGDTLKNLTLPSIGFDVPSQMNGLLNLFGLGKSGGMGRPGIGNLTSSTGLTAGMGQMNGPQIQTDIDLDLVPEIDIDPKKIADELQDMVEDELDDAIDEIERYFQVDLVK